MHHHDYINTSLVPRPIPRFSILHAKNVLGMGNEWEGGGDKLEAAVMGLVFPIIISRYWSGFL